MYDYMLFNYPRNIWHHLNKFDIKMITKQMLVIFINQNLKIISFSSS